MNGYGPNFRKMQREAAKRELKGRPLPVWPEDVEDNEVDPRSEASRPYCYTCQSRDCTIAVPPVIRDS